MRSGDHLIYQDYTLRDEKTNHPIAKLSKRMQDTINEWNSRGYKVTSSFIRFIVAWKPKDSQKEEPEYAVILADMILTNDKTVN